MTKYIVVEKSYEYNDEYNEIQEGFSINNKKLYNSKEEAQEAKKEGILNLFKDYKGNFCSSFFDFKMFNYGEAEYIQEYFTNKGYPFDEDDYQLNLPKGLSKEEILEAYDNWDEDLFQIIELND